MPRIYGEVSGHPLLVLDRLQVIVATKKKNISLEGTMRMVQILAILVAFSFCSASFADQIVLTNGDRLTGTIMKADDKTLVIKTEFAGDVTVQWPAVQEIHSTQALHLLSIT